MSKSGKEKIFMTLKCSSDMTPDGTSGHTFAGGTVQQAFR